MLPTSATSELYFDEDDPPPGLLEVAHQLGIEDYRRCLVVHSLSKRTNLPGLRSGFVAGDGEVLAQYFQYRTYQGCALPPPTHAASIAAWNDEAHVRANRDQYRAKFAAVLEVLAPVLKVGKPDASFYLWPELPQDDETFTRELYARENVLVLPGSYLSRHGQLLCAMAKTHKVEGVLDAEDLPVLDKTAGYTYFVDYSWWAKDKFSGDAGLLWTGAKVGDRLTLGFPVESDGDYATSAVLINAGDYGIVQLSIDGQPVGDPVDLYRDFWVLPGPEINLGTHHPTAGQHTLGVEIVGSYPAAKPKLHVALDYLRLVRTSQSGRP